MLPGLDNIDIFLVLAGSLYFISEEIGWIVGDFYYSGPFINSCNLLKYTEEEGWVGN